MARVRAIGGEHMHRISLAMALLGAVAAAGCGGAGNPSSDGSGGGRGVKEGFIRVTVQNGQDLNPDFAGTINPLAIKGGYVTSTPAGIDCGEGASHSTCTVQFPLGSAIVLDATVVATTTHQFFGWAGDCAGEGSCTLSGNADKYVVAMFGTDRAGHPNWSAGAVHGPMYFAYTRDEPGSLDCTLCHGASLQGQAIAVSCSLCHPWPVHGLATPIAALNKDFASGPAVTAECLNCHSARADQLLGSTHFTWLGDSTTVGQIHVGKRNLINNFCVAVPSNEGRCLQCHPSYSSAPTKDPATGAVAANTGPMYLWAANPAVDKTKIDCLVCHANIGTSRYVKAPAPFGAPWVTTPFSCSPSCAANQICSNTDSAGVAWTDGQNHCRAPNSATEILPALKAAAGSVGSTQRTNCGFCHFNAGGGDNVKMGDLGSALKSPTPAIDVHMGSSASYAPKHCSDCHRAAAGHQLQGTGLSIPVDDEGRLTCTDCHSGLHPPHAELDPALAATLATHVDFMACQTCHIPAFSRTQFTKMNWDWQTAADKQACQGLTGCVGFGSLTYPAGNAQTGTIAGVGGEAPKGSNPVADDPLFAASIERGYDWKKGVSTYAKGVIPVYRFIAPAGTQQGTHETLAADGMAGAGTVDDPYTLSDVTPPPLPVLAGWKIAPFKKMTGRSPGFADGSAMIAPHVFGMDSLWQTDLRGFPVVANNLGSGTNLWTQAKADAVWTGVLNYGAAVAGQLGAPVAKAAGGQMTRAEVYDPDLDVTTHVVTVETVDPLPDFVTTTVYLVGAQAAFPSGVKSITKTGPQQFTYTESLPYTVNTGQPALPALPATSSAFVAFYRELPAADWGWAYTAMLINLNHEVAPAASALSCTSCHPSMGGTVDTSRMKELYDLQVGGCEDPVDCSKR
jgi:hypothetical protein